jgi:hypothetical protein
VWEVCVHAYMRVHECASACVRPSVRLCARVRLFAAGTRCRDDDGDAGCLHRHFEDVISEHTCMVTLHASSGVRQMWKKSASTLSARNSGRYLPACRMAHTGT